MLAAWRHFTVTHMRRPTILGASFTYTVDSVTMDARLRLCLSNEELTYNKKELGPLLSSSMPGGRPASFARTVTHAGDPTRPLARSLPRTDMPTNIESLELGSGDYRVFMTLVG